MGLAILWLGCARSGFDLAVRDAGGEGTWYDLGDSSIGSWGEKLDNLSPRGKVALDSAGNPFAAWNDRGHILVAHFDGARWALVGADSPSGDPLVSSADPPALAVDNADLPIVAWVDDASEISEIYVKRFDGASWVELGAGSASGGGISDNAGRSYAPSLAVGPSGRPAVAWTDQSSGTNQIYVKHFDGVAWVELGAESASGAGMSNDVNSANDPALAVDGSDHPIVAWTSWTGWYQIYVKRFDGAAWAEIGTGSASLGGVSDTASWSQLPDLVLDGSGRPVVAWRDSYGAGNSIYVKRFDGAAWGEVGSGSATDTGISGAAFVAPFAPSIVLDAQGKPVVAWTSFDGILLKGFDGATWVNVGSALSSGALPLTARPSLATGGAGTLVLAGDSGVLRRDGAAWTKVGAPAGGIGGSADLASLPSVTVDATGKPAVAWVGGALDASPNVEIVGMRFDGAAWRWLGPPVSAGGASHSATASTQPSLAADASGNLVAAWLDDLANGYTGQIYVRRLVSTAWEEVGVSSASGGGISESGWGDTPALTLDATGAPVVAWSEGNVPEIFVKRFDGVQWEELGSSSASGGGVSNNTGASCGPALGVSTSGTLTVAWNDDSSGANEIYVRQFDGVSWTDVGVGSASGGGASRSGGVVADFRYVAIGTRRQVDGAVTVRIDASDRPVLAWADQSSGNAEIYVRRFDGVSWIEVGVGSATGGGISNNPGTSWMPSLAVDAAGRFWVAWTDDSGGYSEIYVKRFNGLHWEEVASGSASDGGISNSWDTSVRPSLAIGGGRACVAWQEGSGVFAVISMRCSSAE